MSPAPAAAHQRIADIEGRNDDTFNYSDGVTVHPHVFRSILGRASTISEYQVRQTPVGAEITVCASDALDADDLSRELQSALARAGCSEPAVKVNQVDGIPRLATGKLKRLLTL